MLAQASYCAIPLVGPFVAAANLPPSHSPFMAVDVLLGAYNVIGFGLLLAGYLIPQRQPLPLRPGSSFAGGWSMTPIAGASTGMALRYVW